MNKNSNTKKILKIHAGLQDYLQKIKNKLYFLLFIYSNHRCLLTSYKNKESFLM